MDIKRKELTNSRAEGFSLLEVVIVVIIVGVLSTLGLSYFSRAVESSRAAEALGNLGFIRKGIERCYAWVGDITQCDFSITGWDTLGMSDPGATPGAHFTYQFIWYSPPLEYGIRAIRNSIDGGHAGDTIELTVMENFGIDLSGSGAFQHVH